jgi:hypothetical protein
VFWECALVEGKARVFYHGWQVWRKAPSTNIQAPENNQFSNFNNFPDGRIGPMGLGIDWQHGIMRMMKKSFQAAGNEAMSPHESPSTIP